MPISRAADIFLALSSLCLSKEIMLAALNILEKGWDKNIVNKYAKGAVHLVEMIHYPYSETVRLVA